MTESISLQSDELERIKALLKHTGEFIAYFELADSKMISWREEIEHEMHQQHHRIEQQIQQLQHSINQLDEALTQAGIARLRLGLEQALHEGKNHLQEIQHASSAFQTQSKLILNRLQEQIGQQLDTLHLDIQHNIAELKETNPLTEPDEPEPVTQDISSCSWQHAFITVMCSLLAAIGLALYISGELPWESHKHAQAERKAGKILLRAWPMLTQEERERIIQIPQDEG